MFEGVVQNLCEENNVITTLTLLTKVVFGILSLFKVYKVPSILTKKAIQYREDSKHSNEDNASDEDWVGDL